MTLLKVWFEHLRQTLQICEQTTKFLPKPQTSLGILQANSHQLQRMASQQLQQMGSQSMQRMGSQNLGVQGPPIGALNLQTMGSQGGLQRHGSAQMPPLQSTSSGLLQASL